MVNVIISLSEKYLQDNSFYLIKKRKYYKSQMIFEF